LLPVHALGLADSAPHNKSVGPRHVDLDFGLPSVQLALDYQPSVNLSNFLAVEMNSGNFFAELKRRNAS
jgi:hypothetical protein